MDWANGLLVDINEQYDSTYVTKADGGVNTLHGLNNIVQRSTGLSTSKERTLDASVLLRRSHAHDMVQEV